MEDDYLYDVFISYRNMDPVNLWVKNQFHPLLRRWLSVSLTYKPTIFVDWEQRTGDDWRKNIPKALQRSRCLAAVWSTLYFYDSPWCVAEWKRMEEREKKLGIDNCLVYPVTYFDGDKFPDDAKTKVSVDLSRWSHLVDSYLF
ncbi:MAG: toll/interleukin-1 receptor domain-containing protein [Candidatus Magnetobacterium sp. LHC-1]